MAAADDDRRPDPTDQRRPPTNRDTSPGRHVDTAERVSIHNIADKVKGLLRSRD